MNTSGMTVVGIDVGGCSKGFHAVALRHGQFESYRSTSAAELAEWCQKKSAQIIAIDAPCTWATSGGSRLAERSLAVAGKTIQCFKTPTRIAAGDRDFYGWVVNGETLYKQLLLDYQLFDGINRSGKIVLETFPHAIVCALAGEVISARKKATSRRKSLKDKGYDHAPLRSIDYVDAALCALTAERFLLGCTASFGNAEEGFIVVPR